MHVYLFILTYQKTTETHSAVHEITFITNKNESFLLVNDKNNEIVGF
jgi:hypothetical protein